MKLNELRNATLEYFQRLFPNMPKYVVTDFIYKNYKNIISNVNYQTELQTIVNEYKDYKWKRGVLNITLDIFDSETQKRITQRKGGTANPYQVPKDEERHTTQQQLLQQGPSNEPIIVFHTHQGYELIEGWHRTI